MRGCDGSTWRTTRLRARRSRPASSSTTSCPRCTRLSTTSRGGAPPLGWAGGFAPGPGSRRCSSPARPAGTSASSSRSTWVGRTARATPSMPNAVVATTRGPPRAPLRRRGSSCCCCARRSSSCAASISSRACRRSAWRRHRPTRSRRICASHPSYSTRSAVLSAGSATRLGASWSPTLSTAPPARTGIWRCVSARRRQKAAMAAADAIRTARHRRMELWGARRLDSCRRRCVAS
mmetsp:Transcript_14466/g.38241  ORF Transcript_14466/g.38241 Transcript_14466/m.38241 type:complete len:235 (+) Transcript_14466:260-964(+)